MVGHYGDTIPFIVNLLPEHQNFVSAQFWTSQQSLWVVFVVRVLLGVPFLVSLASILCTGTEHSFGVAVRVCLALLGWVGFSFALASRTIRSLHSWYSLLKGLLWILLCRDSLWPLLGLGQAVAESVPAVVGD